MDQKPLIIANWKMNPTTQKEAEHLFGAVKKISPVNDLTRFLDLLYLRQLIPLPSFASASDGSFLFG